MSKLMSSRLHLLRTPFSPDGLHQSYSFSNEDQQSSYFYNNYLQFTAYDHVIIEPEDGEIRVKVSYERASRANYMMFRNPAYGNKFFYAYIMDIIPQAGNEQVLIKYTMDSFQSYFFEVVRNIKPSYVYREHYASGDLRNYQLTEEVPTGTLKTTRVIDSIEDTSRYREDNDKQYIRWAVFVSTINAETLGLRGGVGGPSVSIPEVEDEHGGLKGFSPSSSGLPGSLHYYFVPFATTPGKKVNINIMGRTMPAVDIGYLSEFFGTDPRAVNSLVKVMIKNDIPLKNIKVRNSSSSITVEIPSMTSGFGNPEVGYGFTWAGVYPSQLDRDGTVIAQTGNKWAGLHSDPRLNRPPFTRFYIETEDGAQVEFDPDLIPGRELKLIYRTNMGPVDNSILHIDNYGGSGSSTQYEAYTEFASSKSIATKTSALSAMLQSQENQMQSAKTVRKRSSIASVIGAGLGTAVGAGITFATGGAGTSVGAIAGIATWKMISGAANSLLNAKNEDIMNEARINDKKNEPDSVGNVGADITYNMLNGRYKSMIKIKTITPEYKRLAEDYFKQNGYSVMRVKIPNLKTNRSFNYVKANINLGSASIPLLHKMKIQEIFASGVTFWHTSDVYNYNRKN